MNLLGECFDKTGKVLAQMQTLTDHRAKADPMAVFHQLKDLREMLATVMGQGIAVDESTS